MVASIITYRYCYIEKAKSVVHKIKLSLFCDFFPLGGYFLPYIYRGTTQEQGRKRRKENIAQKGKIKKLGKTRKRKKEIDVQTKRMHNKQEDRK